MKVKTQNPKADLIKVITEILMNCPETCKIEKENEVVISVPVDKLIERITENLRKNIYEIVSNGALISSLKNELEKEKGSKFEGKLIKDLDGLVFDFKKSK